MKEHTKQPLFSHPGERISIQLPTPGKTKRPTASRCISYFDVSYFMGKLCVFIERSFFFFSSSDKTFKKPLWLRRELVFFFVRSIRKSPIRIPTWKKSAACHSRVKRPDDGGDASLDGIEMTEQ